MVDAIFKTIKQEFKEKQRIRTEKAGIEHARYRKIPVRNQIFTKEEILLVLIIYYHS